MSISRAFSFASCWCILLFALPPVAAVAEDEPTGPELIREVRQAEQWIHEVETFFVKFKTRIEKTERAIAARRKELESRFPDSENTAERHPGLRPEITGTLEVAFDHESQRLRHWRDRETSLKQSVWDGEQLIVHEKYFTHDQEHYALDDEVERFIGRYFLADLPWLRTWAHDFWWRELSEAGVSIYRKAEGYELVGRDRFEDVGCYVVQSTYKPFSQPRRYYIDVENHRLRGLEIGAFDASPKTQLHAINDLAAAYGESFNNPAAAKAWLESQPKAKANKLTRKLDRKLWSKARPVFRYTYSNYKKIGEGQWIPMTQGYVNYDSTENGSVYVASRWKHEIAEVRVDEPLADELFEIEMREGVKVVDWRWDPPLGPITYPHDPDRTDGELKELVNEARQEHEKREAKRQAQKELIGEPAAAFAEDAAWLNSEGLSWDKLRGKVVLIDFWATWCGPCRNDIPLLRTLHDEREDKGIVVIGAHTPDGDPAEVLKFMKKFEIEYPVYIDENAKQPADAPWFPGRLFTGSRIWAIPHSMVVDREGNIAAHGKLQNVLRKANELAERPDKQVN